jgi:transposase InsO family protein
MTKHLADDTLIMLHNKLAGLAIRDSKRKLIIKEAAELYGVSTATIYRYLRKYSKLSTTTRADYNCPRLLKYEEIKKYCQLIAALKLRTTNKKGRHLSNVACIRILEDYGIETAGELVKAPKGLLKTSTVSFYLRRFGLEHSALSIQPTFVRFQAEQSNECWQFDFSHSDFKGFIADKPKEESGIEAKLMLLGVIDDRSGVKYQEYHYCYGEDVLTALKFLFNAFSVKKYPGMPFQGIPKTIYTDNGSVAKSSIFKRVMAHLNIKFLTHLPDGRDGRRKTARSKGKIERSFRSIKESLETLYHLHPPQSLLEANEWLRHYLERYNDHQHRTEAHSRLEDWKKHLPKEGFQAMCDWEHFTILVREPEIRKVGNDACVNVNGIKYQLSPELAGVTVTLLWGLFDNELRVSYKEEHYGPFYPAGEPIPFGSYRSFKKSSKEKQVDQIEQLAKVISIPRSVLTNGDITAKELINAAKLSEEKQIYMPFVRENPFEQAKFKDIIEAKTAIARWLGYPLGRLLPEQLKKINSIVAENLDKKLIMMQVKQLFKIQGIQEKN